MMQLLLRQKLVKFTVTFYEPLLRSRNQRSNEMVDRIMNYIKKLLLLARIGARITRISLHSREIITIFDILSQARSIKIGLCTLWKFLSTSQELKR